MGWEPTEVHEHEYDDDGRLARTVVTREPEWDDLERDKMHDLDAYEAEVHELCGLHDSVAQQNPDMRIEPVSCPMCADVERLMRVQREADEAEDKARFGEQRPPASAKQAGDGRRGWRTWLLTAEEKAAEASSSAKPGSRSSRGRKRPQRGSPGPR